MRRTAAIPLLAVLAAAPAAAQVEWMTEEMEQAAAGGLVIRMAEVGVGIPGTLEEQANQSLALIRDITGRIDDWGIDGVIERAPTIPEVELPEFSNPLISTMASYGLCGLMLEPESATARDERVASVLGEYFVMLVSAYLRDWLVDTGGDDAELQAELGSEEMNRISREVRLDEEKLGAVRRECGPMFLALFAP